MSAAELRPESPVAAIVARYASGVTCWFAGDYLSASVHLERALAIYGAEPDPSAFKASTLDLPSVIMRFLHLCFGRSARSIGRAGSPRRR